MKTYTAFCQESSGEGTIWIEAITVNDDDSIDQVALQAMKACADAWGGDEEDVRCLGLLDGDCKVVHWEDL